MQMTTSRKDFVYHVCGKKTLLTVDPLFKVLPLVEKMIIALGNVF